jgi:hypothetical protein
MLYKWVADLPQEQFSELLPLLRRTFARFEPADRRQLGAKAKQGVLVSVTASDDNAPTTINPDRARQTLSVVRELLG